MQTELNIKDDVLEIINAKRKEELVWIPIEDVFGYEDAPEPKKAFNDSVGAHQIYPILVNYNSTKKQYEIVDGRRRILGRNEAGKDTVLAIVYTDLTVAEKSFLTRIPHENRSENYIHLYHVVKALLSEGINPIEIKDDRLRMKKSLFEKVCRIDSLIDGFRDAFLSNDSGFGFARAQKVAKLSKPLQEELFEIYNDKGKITNDDIKKVKQAKVAQDIQEMFSPELLQQLHKRHEWKPEAFELVNRLTAVCPEDSALKALLNEMTHSIEAL